MNTKKIAGIIIVTLALSASSYGQAKLTEGFLKTSRGLYYKLIVDKHLPKAKLGDIIKMNLVYSTQNDSVLFSTYEANIGPVQFTINTPTFNGDPMEGY